jgi:hypothetical protein
MVNSRVVCSIILMIWKGFVMIVPTRVDGDPVVDEVVTELVR